MKALQHLLVPTDLSAPARHAAERAARLAHETGARLSLLHVLPGGALAELQQWLGSGNEMEQRVRQDAGQRLQALADELHAARHVPVQVLCSTGPVPDEIGRQATALDASLLVLGARGAGFLRRLVMGSTAERVLRRTRRPLLMVRQSPHEPYRRALLALDFSPWSAQAVHLARRVAPHAQLVLLHAFSVPFEEKLQFAGVDSGTVDLYRRQSRAMATQRVHNVAHAAGLKTGQWQPLILEGDASRCIVEQEQEQDCDLVVLGKHGQSAAEDLLLGSVTKHVLAEGSCDVLVSTAQDAPLAPAQPAVADASNLG